MLAAPGSRFSRHIRDPKKMCLRRLGVTGISKAIIDPFRICMPTPKKIIAELKMDDWTVCTQQSFEE